MTLETERLSKEAPLSPQKGAKTTEESGCSPSGGRGATGRGGGSLRVLAPTCPSDSSRVLLGWKVAEAKPPPSVSSPASRPRSPSSATSPPFHPRLPTPPPTHLPPSASPRESAFSSLVLSPGPAVSSPAVLLTWVFMTGSVGELWPAYCRLALRLGTQLALLVMSRTEVTA